MGFSFKAFHVVDDGCGMPVSTDAVLLGAWAELDNATAILDLGAGSGLLSLMAAQRSPAPVCAVEIDETAARACQANFDASPWGSRLSLIFGDACRPEVLGTAMFSHILCNPPYFETGPLSHKPGRAQARHTGSLDFDTLAILIARHLDPQGTASLVLPTHSEPAFARALQTAGLSLTQRVAVSTVIGKSPSRLLLGIGHRRGPVQQHALAIRDQYGNYTESMIALTRDFYLKL